MKQFDRPAFYTGFLFFIALLLNIIANEIAKPIIDNGAFLTQAYPHRHLLTAVNLLNITCALAMIFIPLVILPVVEKPYRHLAVGYCVFRCLEGLLFIHIAIKTFGFTGISETYLANTGKTAAFAFIMGKSNYAEIQWTTIVYLITYCCGALLFYYLLQQLQWVPKWLSVWGWAGVLLLMAGTVMAMAGTGMFKSHSLMQGMVWFAPPIALNELVLSVWFMAKGFGKPIAGKRTP